MSEAVLESMRRVFWYVQYYEKQFAQMQMQSFGEEKKKSLLRNAENFRGKKRIKEIDVLIQKIYEDNASGKILDERFATMSLAFEEEQRKLNDGEAYLESEIDKSEGLQRFIDKVKCITQPTELSAEVVHEFVEKIVVSKPDKVDGKRHQTLDIYYNGVGIIREPTPEEMEELFESICRNGKLPHRQQNGIAIGYTI